MEDTLTVLFNAGGVDALLDGYRALRNEQYGRGSFDFGEDVLLVWAVDIAQSGSLDGALKVLEANAEYHPDSDNIQFMMGILALNGGDLKTAKLRFENALKLNPNNEAAKQQLDELD